VAQLRRRDRLRVRRPIHDNDGVRNEATFSARVAIDDRGFGSPLESRLTWHPLYDVGLLYGVIPGQGRAPPTATLRWIRNDGSLQGEVAIDRRSLHVAPTPDGFVLLDSSHVAWTTVGPVAEPVRWQAIADEQAFDPTAMRARALVTNAD
jgi:hypothetical protein